MDENEICRELMAYAEADYATFQARLLPTVKRERILGVRTPYLRRMARRIAATGEREAFFSRLPHTYFEEDQLHAFLIETLTEYDAVMTALSRFLPFVDNWATADQMLPRALARERARLRTDAECLLSSPYPYAVRYGIGLLMRFFLEEDFSPEIPRRIAEIEREEYYIRMMEAWYFATALAKQYDEILPYFENNSLPLWVHNKAISKACESRRVSMEHKDYLRSLRRKA